MDSVNLASGAGQSVAAEELDRLRAELAALPVPRMLGGRIVLAVDGRRG